MLANPAPAPELNTMQWLNTIAPITLSALRGKVIVLGAFQARCPSCVSRALPQMQRVQRAFSPDDVAVIGLHSVFERHSAMEPETLAIFLEQHGIDFPVGIDTPAKDDDIPMTMRAYQMQGTPTSILIDRIGRLRKQKLGTEQDMIFRTEITILLEETYNDASQMH